MMLGRENSWLSLLNSCNTLISVKQIHAHFTKTGFDVDPLSAGKLILHCAVTISDHALDYARRFFDHFPDPDVFMYNTLIRGFSESRTPQDSFGIFNELRKSSVASPDSFSFAFVLKAAANLRSFWAGVQVHSLAVTHGLDTHIFVGTTLVSMYGECGRADCARKVFDDLPDPNVVAWNAIVTACFRCADLDGARAMFDKMSSRNSTSYNILLAGCMRAGEVGLAQRVFVDMPVKDDVSWSTMIVGYAHCGCFDEAFCLFRSMQRMGMRPSEVSLTGILSACADAGAFEFGKILHGLLQKAGFSEIVSVNNALVDAYSKCGNVHMARLVFKTMAEKSLVTWTSMIAGLAMHGYSDDAIQLFHEMEESGVRPDGITFVSLLYACSHSGLIDWGCRYFSKMKYVYGIEPSIEHYGCMVDLYGRAGQLKKAYCLVSEMPIKPTAIIWRTLLGACSIHGNVELGELVRRRLSELDPENSGDHVLLSNIYATAGKWKEVAAVRRSMSEQRIKKSPGWSMIEIDKMMYNFVAGQKQSSVTEEAYEKLKEIMLKLRDERGYVPEVNSVLHDIEEEEKESSVSMHSEKLALAFGIARLCKGSTIRIVKNLRICRDCHAFMKLVSALYEVGIVVRDRSRFHSFKDGSCSCRDYW